MSKLLYRWLYLPLWCQGLVVCLFVSLLAVAVWQLEISPLRQTENRLLLQQRQQVSHYQRLLRQLAAGGSVSVLEADIGQLQQAASPVAADDFSLHQLLQVSGGALAEWQPASQGGALTLSLKWHQVQEVFRYLSSLPSGLTLPHFTLKPEQQNLRLQLSLGLNHDT